jgi:tetratricopeptide (TPR) repeat protein
MCSQELRARNWSAALAHCEATSNQAALARAWQASDRGQRDTAITAAEALFDTEVGIDAAYLVGYLRADSDDPATSAFGRALLHGALTGYQLVRRHAEASRTASTLSRVPRPEARFEDALEYARLAVSEAEKSGDQRAWGLAETALAEVYDDIGREEDARDAFLSAAGHLVAARDVQAFTYMKHGVFLVDLGSEHQIRAGLAYLEHARAQIRGIAEPDNPWRMRIEFPVKLNRATALAELGELDAAEAELAVVTADGEKAMRRLALVRGYIASRRGDLAAAEGLFAQAALDKDDLDYRWWFATELARAYLHAGKPADAERSYLEATRAVEALRATANEPELRPWVLARYRKPYIGLLGLMADQGRGLDALVAAESLHARTWLDVVLGRDRLVAGAQQSLLDARLRQRPEAWPALSGPEILARLDGREAIVLISVGATLRRVHVTGGVVTIVALSTDDRAAIEQFHRTPGDPAAAMRAALALLPAGVGDRATPLYVVAGGELADLPFAALRVGGRFLVEARPIVRLPGLSTLGCRAGTWTDARIFLGDSLGDLPKARAEVQRLAGMDALVGKAADRSAFAQGARAALLHAAVHGRLTSSGGALDLADGPMTAAAVADQQIGPRVVMLTGCATSAGADAEAWSGFPSAFLAAGSRYVIATLRSVGDADAAEVVRAYHAQPEELGPVARLAAAQRTLVTKLPVEAWASFAVWGDAACGP